MQSIESSPYPRIFKLAKPVVPHADELEGGVELPIITAARALTGMQKEALVDYKRTGTTWRLFCDEGPWLNGTNLAPFPLGFFSAGLAASFLSELLAHAARTGVRLEGPRVVVDSYYGMEGSMMKGTMTGNAFPVHVSFRIVPGTDRSTIPDLGRLAVDSAPAQALLRESLDNRFTLIHNGKPTPLSPSGEPAGDSPPDPLPCFDNAKPAASDEFASEIIARLDDVDTLGGDAIGSEPPSSDVGLSDTQKRSLHVRCIGSVRDDDLKDLKVACMKPASSVFRLLSDDSAFVGGRERAPSGLAYLSAGLAFCFLTQLGRYAQMAKHELGDYRTMQTLGFSVPAAADGGAQAPRASAAHTDVFIDDKEDAAQARKLVKMGEQTCYLHAACRRALETRVRS